MSNSNTNQSENKNPALTRQDYTGSKSTLCTGCGHDQITNHIVTACFQLGLNPSDVFKVSGIGCSSKLPAYFLGKSFGVNSLHGRMAPVATGAKIAQHNKIVLGVSGDGDTASIGMGGFIHTIRRNLPMCYIVANNGVYGLTKGQFSATSEKGSQLKHGEHNPFDSIDLCLLSLDLGATFVARSFSGDAKQLVPLIQAALKHKGIAFLDVISPCVSFNNHDGSTKSFSYVKEHDQALQELGFFTNEADVPQVDYKEGSTQLVKMVDGSHLHLKKLDPKAHNVNDRIQAQQALLSTQKTGEIITGLFYIDENSETLIDTLNLPNKSICDLTEKELRPSKIAFDKFMKAFP